MQVGPARRKVTHPWRLRVKRRGPLPLGFSQVLILNLVKVLYFDTLLQVLILKVVSRELDGPPFGLEKPADPALRRATKS